MDRFQRTDLTNLSELLNFGLQLEKNDDLDQSTVNNWTPQDAANKVLNKNYDKDDKRKNFVKNISKNIWDDDEVSDEEADDADKKLKPEYELIYQQNVTPDDIFLQMSGKDPSSQCCEGLIIKIKLPGTASREDINVNTSASKLICKTKKFYLSLDLPKEIDPVKSSAKWIPEEKVLAVKLFVDDKCSTKIEDFAQNI